MKKHDHKVSASIRFYGLCGKHPRPSASMRSGYTMIELLVVIALTTLIASFAIVYSRQSGTQIALYVEAQKMAELVFKAKSMALTAYRDPALGNICGFGFAVDYTPPIGYSLFSYRVDGGGSCSGIASVDTGRVNSLPGQRYLVHADVALDGGSVNALQYVLFIPPNPTTIVVTNDGNPSPTGAGGITLQVANGTAMTITVSSGGQISF